MTPRDDYASSLDGIRVLAQRDLLSWWKNTAHLAYADQRELMEEPFQAIVWAYGEQASYAAADYLFLQRSLDDELRDLAYPEVADPVGFEQARASYRYGMWLKRKTEDDSERQLALRRLQGITNRLVMKPAQDTVFASVAHAGTRYARIPEPGACPFCLMLASRGAVYAIPEAAGNEMRRYHDNCRCLGIEVKRESDLPRINRDLNEQWRRLGKEVGGHPGLKEWRRMLVARREQAGGTVRWPKLQYCTVPKYRRNGKSRVFKGEPLPDLRRMPGHVLHGWRDRPARDGRGVPHTEDLRQGHRWDSERSNASKFKREWTDQKIVDSVRDTIEDPEMYDDPRDGNSRVVYKRVDGQWLQAKYTMRPDGSYREGTLEAYPVEAPRKGAKRVRN